jgi:hypothetical protein
VRWSRPRWHIERKRGLLKQVAAGGPKLLWQVNASATVMRTNRFVVGSRLLRHEQTAVWTMKFDAGAFNAGRERDLGPSRRQCLVIRTGTKLPYSEIRLRRLLNRGGPPPPISLTRSDPDGDIFACLDAKYREDSLETKTFSAREFGGKPGTWPLRGSPLVERRYASGRTSRRCGTATMLALNKKTGGGDFGSRRFPEASRRGTHRRIVVPGGGTKAVRGNC